VHVRASGHGSTVEASVLTTDAATERPIFVAANGRRARWLRYGGAFAVLLGCLWVAALAIGMLGVGRLPGLPLPSVVTRDDGAPPARDRTTVHSSVPVSPAAAVRDTPAVRPATPEAANASAARQRAQTRRASTTSVRPSTRARGVPDAGPPAQVTETPVAAQPAPAPTPTPVQQGWGRRGYTTPPGQTQRTETPAPATAPGQARQETQDPTTSPAPAPPPAAPVTPPGQQKKAEDPPTG
jgi:hypothetical protein